MVAKPTRHLRITSGQHTGLVKLTYLKARSMFLCTQCVDSAPRLKHARTTTLKLQPLGTAEAAHGRRVLVGTQPLGDCLFPSLDRTLAGSRFALARALRFSKGATHVAAFTILDSHITAVMAYISKGIGVWVLHRTELIELINWRIARSIN